jgi:hypothetical protein
VKKNIFFIMFSVEDNTRSTFSFSAHFAQHAAFFPALVIIFRSWLIHLFVFFFVGTPRYIFMIGLGFSRGRNINISFLQAFF